MIRVAPLLVALVLPALVSAQIAIDNSLSPAALVQNILLGQGVTVSNITFNGQSASQVHEQIGAFSGDSNIGLMAGVIMATGDVQEAEGPNDDPFSAEGGGNYDTPDPDLEILSNDMINDKAVLEFDFIPTGDSLKFDFVFASEEYPDFVCGVNDAFGFFLSGPGINGPFSDNAINIALIPGTTVPVSINTVNSGEPGEGYDESACALSDPDWDTHTAFFVENGDGWTSPYDQDAHYVQFNGFTTVLRALARVSCGVQYHIKLAIGDAFDTSYDSAVFLEEGSFSSTGQVVPQLTSMVGLNDSTLYEGCGILTLDFLRSGDTTGTDTVHMVISGSATPGVDYSPALPTELVYHPGDTVIHFPLTVPLDPDGLENIHLRITQNVICSGTQVVGDYDFYIATPPPLLVITNDIVGTCGETYDLAPPLTGGTGLAHFLWSTGETTPTIHVAPAVTTTYYFTVSDTCSVVPISDSITVTMPVYPPLAITVSPDTALPCLGHGPIGVTASGGNGTYAYAWSVDGSPYGNTAVIDVPAADTVYYAVTVTEGCGLSATDSVQVTTAVLPDIVITLNDTTVMCPGDTVVLRPQVTGGNGVYTYAWRNAFQLVIGSADTLQVAVPADASYGLLVQDQCGYAADTTIATLLPHYDPFTLAVSADTLICEYDTARIAAQVSGGSGTFTLAWAGTDWTDPVHDVSPYENTVYQVAALDACGALLSDEVRVDVEHPRATILIRNLGQDDRQFQAQTLPYVCRTYRWDLGDSTLSEEVQLYHSYVDLDDHWVHLHVVSFTGCTAADSLLVSPPGHLYFPTAFTPDGDGINETFGPVGHNIEEFAMSIFDRWGHLVFETKDATKVWDGKVNGSDPATTGVYVYRYRAKGHYFEADESYGHVTLLRGSQGPQ